MPYPHYDITDDGRPVIRAHYRNYTIYNPLHIFHFLINSWWLDHEARPIVTHTVYAETDYSRMDLTQSSRFQNQDHRDSTQIDLEANRQRNPDEGQSDGIWEGCMCTGCVTMFILFKNWSWNLRRDFFRQCRDYSQGRTDDAGFLVQYVVFEVLFVFNFVVTAILVWWFTPVVSDLMQGPLYGFHISVAAVITTGIIVMYCLLWLYLFYLIAIVLVVGPVGVLLGYFGCIKPEHADYSEVCKEAFDLLNVAYVGTVLITLTKIGSACISVASCLRPCLSVYGGPEQDAERDVEAGAQTEAERQAAYRHVGMTPYDPGNTRGRLDPNLVVDGPDLTDSVELAHMSRAVGKPSTWKASGRTDSPQNRKRD